MDFLHGVTCEISQELAGTPLGTLEQSQLALVAYFLFDMMVICFGVIFGLLINFAFIRGITNFLLSYITAKSIITVGAAIFFVRYRKQQRMITVKKFAQETH